MASLAADFKYLDFTSYTCSLYATVMALNLIVPYFPQNRLLYFTVFVSSPILVLNNSHINVLLSREGYSTLHSLVYFGCHFWYPPSLQEKKIAESLREAAIEASVAPVTFRIPEPCDGVITLYFEILEILWSTSLQSITRPQPPTPNNERQKT